LYPQDIYLLKILTTLLETKGLMKLKKGYVHIYTGDGKGKTTAAIGLALRAIGAGMKVFIVQFLKGKASSEFIPLAKLSDSIVFVHYGRGCLIKDKPTEEDKDLALRGIKEAHEAIVSGKYDLVILDEAIVAVLFALLSLDDLLDLIKKKPDHVELVFTGRKADPKLIEAADLVTEMKEIKHYYSQGVLARAGIED
jgi:cob(I)alamin adenosyltransferase